MYTCLFQASQTGETCFDPLMFHYPEHESTFRDMENTFIVANSLKVTPVLDYNTTLVTSYFPNGDWVSMSNYNAIIPVNDPSGGMPIGFSVDHTKNEQIITHLMPGRLIPFYNNSQQLYYTTKDIQTTAPLEFVINRDSNGHAEGTVFLDGGEEMSELEGKEYEFYKFMLNNKTLTKWVLNE